MVDQVLCCGSLDKKEKSRAIMDVTERRQGKYPNQRKFKYQITYIKPPLKCSRIHFDQFGQKFGAGDTSGNLCLWRFDAHAHSNKPYYVSFFSYMVIFYDKTECLFVYRP